MEAQFLPPQTYPSCLVQADQQIFCEHDPFDQTGSSKKRGASLGQLEELVILFLDIRNFTTLMEKQNAYDIIFILKNLMRRFNSLIGEFAGQVIETAGDSIYAVFGRGQSSLKKASQNSLNAAYSIINDLETFNAKFAEPFLQLHFELGIGIHKGEVIVGQSLLHEQDGLSVMGLPVNIASRLQDATKELNNNLIMSEEAFQLLDEDQDNALKTHLALKGITSPVPVRLLGKAFGSTPFSKEDELNFYLAYAG